MTPPIRTVKGYTAQARYYASAIAKNAADEWTQAGWTRLETGHVKPVFLLTDGRPIVICDGRDHLTVTIHVVDRTAIRTTEDDCYR